MYGFGYTLCGRGEGKHLWYTECRIIRFSINFHMMGGCLRYMTKESNIFKEDFLF